MYIKSIFVVTVITVYDNSNNLILHDFFFIRLRYAVRSIHFITNKYRYYISKEYKIHYIYGILVQ